MSAVTDETQVQSEVASTPNNTTAIVPRQDQAPAVFTQDADAEGEFDKSDLEKPKLSIVAKTGKLSNDFTPGTFLLNGEYVIGDTKAPLIVVPVAIRKLYQNDLDFDSGEMGDTVSTAVEVANRGGVVDYRPNDEKEATHYWKPVLQVAFLIEKPNGLTPDAEMFFPFAIGDKDYTIASFWASSKSAYNGVAKPLIMAKQGKSKSVRGSIYRFSTKGESTKDNKRSWIQATLRATGPTPQEIPNFLTTIG